MLLSVLPATMDKGLDELSPYMQLKDDETTQLLDILDKATINDYVPEGYAKFTLPEILSCLVIFMKRSSNSIALYNSGITKLLFKIFKSHPYDIQKLCLEVIISLLQFDSICNDAFTSTPDLLFLLRYLQQSPCVTISFLAENALSYYQWNCGAVYG